MEHSLLCFILTNISGTTGSKISNESKENKKKNGVMESKKFISPDEMKLSIFDCYRISDVLITISIIVKLSIITWLTKYRHFPLIDIIDNFELLLDHPYHKDYIRVVRPMTSCRHRWMKKHYIIFWYISLAWRSRDSVRSNCALLFFFVP